MVALMLLSPACEPRSARTRRLNVNCSKDPTFRLGREKKDELSPAPSLPQIPLSLSVLKDQGRSIHHSSRTSHMDQNLENLIRERAWAVKRFTHAIRRLVLGAYS